MWAKTDFISLAQPPLTFLGCLFGPCNAKTGRSIVPQVDQGKAKEGLISVGSTQLDEPDPLDPEIIQRLDNRFSYRDIPEEYYTDEDGDEVCWFVPCSKSTASVSRGEGDPWLVASATTTFLTNPHIENHTLLISVVALVTGRASHTVGATPNIGWHAHMHGSVVFRSAD